MPSEAFSLTGTIGFLFAWEQQDSFRESDGTFNDDTTTRLGQLRFGGRASYYSEPAGIGLETFLSGTFNYDAIRTERAVLIGRAPPSNDRTDIVLTFGLNADFTDALSANIEFSNTFARQDFSNQTLLVGLKYVF
jgi:outer membrane autotransporter protein